MFRFQTSNIEDHKKKKEKKRKEKNQKSIYTSLLAILARLI